MTPTGSLAHDPLPEPPRGTERNKLAHESFSQIGCDLDLGCSGIRTER